MTRGRVSIVGIGPGSPQGMTIEARQALEECDILVGYGEYVRLAEAAVPGKPCFTTPMTKEVQRCRYALDKAREGLQVALVCSGDAGVYGMASPVLELAEDYDDVDVVVVAGVSAAQSCAAILGAPLGHDFAVVSLSDRLTPWDVIERRVRLACLADLCLVLYNPRSHAREDALARAARAMLEIADEDTVCGWVRAASREGQDHGIVRLGDLSHLEADMFTTVFVGNSQTRMVAGRMVTPRGYHGLAASRNIKDGCRL